MNKLFRLVSLLVVLVMVLGFFATPMSAGNQVSAQKEVPTFVVAPTEIPTDEPVQEPTEPPAEEPNGEVPTEPVEEVTPVPTDGPEVVPLIEAAADVAVPGSYIVVYKDGVDKDAVRLSVLEKINAGAGKVKFEYSSAVDGLAAEFSPEVLRLLRQDPRIEYIEMDQKVTVHDEDIPFSVQTLDSSPDSWGLDRIDGDLDGQFYYPSSAGQGVNIYIIDTGIRDTHMNFNGRATLDFDVFSGSTPYGYDCAGHGTHVAGTAAGIFTGIARKANIHSVRVLDCYGSGAYSYIIAGVNWVAQNHVKPAVANMSLGGSSSPTLDSAVNKAISKGVTFVVSAGNDGEYGSYWGNACNSSPARVPAAITVGATDNSDTRAGFSNFGKCVDIFAPGVNITSSIMDSDGSFQSGWDGTSMAAPHVTGVVALYLSANPTAKPADVAKYIIGNSELNVVDDEMGSPDRLLHIPSTVSNSTVLVSPAKNAFIATHFPQFVWKPTINADQFDVMVVNADFDLNHPILDEYTEEFQLTSPVSLSDGLYYWAVFAFGTKMGTSNFASFRPFTIDTTPPAAPVLTFPATGAQVNGIPTFKWLAPSGAKAYRFGYDFDSDPSGLVEFSETTKLVYKPANLPINTSFYWYVQARDSLGNWSDWSVGRPIEIIPLKPAAPKLLAPTNNFSTKDTTPTFTWTGVTYADTYHIQIAKDSKFTTNMVEYTAPLGGLTYDWPDALPEGKYYWHVQAINADGVAGLYSTPFAFNIDLTAPAAPSLSSPIDGKEFVGTTTFTWTVPPTAKTFLFQYTDSDLFSDAVTSGVLTKATFKPVSLPQGDYYWRVKAIDSALNESEWSAFRLMHVLPAPPAKPGLIEPATGFFTDDTSIDFSWTQVNYASQYEIQIDNNSSFTSPEISTTAASGENSKNVDISSLGTGTWYWRVRGVNSNSVAGPWSMARYFYQTFEFSVNFSSAVDKNYFTEFSNGATWYVDPVNGYLNNDGIVDSWDTSSIAYSSNLSNFTVEIANKNG